MTICGDSVQLGPSFVYLFIESFDFIFHEFYLIDFVEKQSKAYNKSFSFRLDRLYTPKCIKRVDTR